MKNTDVKTRLADRTDDWNVRRKEVVATAAELFAIRGVDSVSMRDIAAAAGLHVSTLYYYFPGKAELYQAATHWAFDRISSATMRVLESGGAPRYRIRRLTETIIAFLMEDRIAARLLDYDFVFGTSLWNKADYPQLTREPTQMFARLLAEIRSPLVDRIGAERLAEITWDVIYGITRFLPAHARLAQDDHVHATQRALVDEAWAVVERILFDDAR